MVLSFLSTEVMMPLRPQWRYESERIPVLRQSLAIAIFVIVPNAFTVHFWSSTWALLAIVPGALAELKGSIYLHPFTRDDEPPRPAAMGSVERTPRVKRISKRSMTG